MTVASAQQNVLQPSDAIIASSSNSPGSEGVANAIDGKPTKYLNFDGKQNAKPSGFVVTPAVGATRVVGMTIESANDGPERDPKVVTLEGSNDDVADYTTGTWVQIVQLDVPAFAARFETKTLPFSNVQPYKHYRWTVVETQSANDCCMQVAEVGLLGGVLPPNVAQPGDPIIASSSNSPGSEGVANAIDGKPTKYLNFDGKQNAKPSGFVVSPAIGKTVVTGMTIQSANDAPERDPKAVTLEGSNDDVADYTTGTWVLITQLDVPAFTARFQTQTFLFDNIKPYKHYRWTVVQTQAPNDCCMQVAEVGFLGSGAPKNVAQPGDPIVASSSNSPGSEGVANVIDGKPTKYLNFDGKQNAKPSGFATTPSVGATTVTGMAIESANDAPERDPKTVTLEGSNDDTLDYTTGNWELIASLEVPAFTARFEWQEFFFANTKAFKNYRWTVVQTQSPNDCCMQVAEVELLAVTSGADCSKAKFLVQPVNTPVLEGATATFSTTVNGPWPLQWYKNGEVITGANGVTYTTPAVTPQTATNTYTVQIVGCEVSSPVQAVIFTPSTTKSLAISFVGGGANGTPTAMNLQDITGVQSQAYWNNATNGSGALPDQNVDPVQPLLNSDNQESTVTFEWATSGTWGSGTGDGTATQRMLNGMVYDNPGGDPATFTFSNVPDGNHAVLIYAVNMPLQFQNATYKVTGQTTKSYYMRVMNSDEYNAAPGVYRGASTDPANPTVGDFIRFDDVRPVGGQITVTVDCTTSGYDRGVGMNGLQLVLNAQNPGAPPTITQQPQPTVVPTGGTAIMSVMATGENLTYQWRKGGRNLPNGGNVSGATTSTLTINAFNTDNEGVYSVAVFNPAGSVISGNATIRVSKYDIVDALVGYWTLNESSGTTAANSANGGKAGTVTGTPSWIKGQIANAFSFDGASYIFVPDYPLAKKAISAAAWVNVSAGTATDVAIIRNAQGALTTSGGAARIVGQFELGLTYNVDTGALAPMAAVGIGPNVARVTASQPISTGAYHHVAFTADGAQLRLYVDGQEVAFTDYLADINTPDVPYLSIGARLNLDTQEPPVLGPDETSANYMQGPLDDIGLWTRSLTAEEVTKIYQAGKQGQPLTSVVVTPPAANPEFTSITKNANGTVTVEWTGGGTLQAAPTVTGPWDNVPGATSPYTLTPDQAQLYGRIVK